MKSIKQGDSSKRLNVPKRIIQFGEGNFLRAFVDWIIYK